ncbi:MAG: TIM barrel protein [Anaerolineae bacterium]|nr:TIM barrel protein [Anaerolineae bacterium]
MIIGGLVSITFRQLTVDAIIKLVQVAGLDAIEWGGDDHVPHGDLVCARETKRKMLDSGLTTASYGSYYRVGHHEPVPFVDVLASATALGAPLIRVWAGKRNSEEADDAYWQQVVDDAITIANLSAEAGKEIAFEYHGNTLTNTLSSTVRLLQDINHPAVKTYWQKPNQSSLEENVVAINQLLPWLSHLHLNSGPNASLRNSQPTSDNTEWLKYFDIVSQTNKDHCALIEFVQDNAPESFLRDARVLKAWLEQANS